MSAQKGSVRAGNFFFPRPSLPPSLLPSVWENPRVRSALRVDSTLLCLGMPTLLIAATIYGPSVCEQGTHTQTLHSFPVNTATCSAAWLTLSPWLLQSFLPFFPPNYIFFCLWWNFTGKCPISQVCNIGDDIVIWSYMILPCSHVLLLCVCWCRCVHRAVMLRSGATFLLWSTWQLKRAKGPVALLNGPCRCNETVHTLKNMDCLKLHKHRHQSNHALGVVKELDTRVLKLFSCLLMVLCVCLFF